MTVKELKKLLRFYRDDAELIIAEDGLDCQLSLELSIGGVLGGDQVFVTPTRTFEDGIKRVMDTNKVFFNTSNFFASEEDLKNNPRAIYYSTVLKNKNNDTDS